MKSKRPEVTVKEFLNNGLIIAFFFGTVGIALKFVTFFDRWVYFPSFPDTLDSAFLILGSIYFVAVILKNKKERQKVT